ncbi:MAG: signal peptidase I [Anaerorhabdus sp.]|uniref:signal peptidase I n=1 Tax=Anaerorhabdus sp. TaxID=1872524 RepID=UPI003A8C0C2E
MKEINWKHEILDFLKTLGICFLIIFVLTRFFIRPVNVNQNSMYPTILDKSFGVSNVFSVKALHDVNRFDIVVINLEDGKNLIKRVVGLPNETISFKNDTLYIDGQPVEENFFNEEYRKEEIQKYGYFTENMEPITLGPDEVFCVGDNRPYSRDSRDYGPFKESQIMSKGLFVITPLDRFGGVK